MVSFFSTWQIFCFYFLFFWHFLHASHFWNVSFPTWHIILPIVVSSSSSCVHPLVSLTSATFHIHGIYSSPFKFRSIKKWDGLSHLLPVDLSNIGAGKDDGDELNKGEDQADPDVHPGERVLDQIPLQHHLDYQDFKIEFVQPQPIYFLMALPQGSLYNRPSRCRCRCSAISGSWADPSKPLDPPERWIPSTVGWSWEYIE